MKRLPILATVLLCLAACASNNKESDDSTKNTGNTEFRSPKGDIIAIRTINGADTVWAFNNALGEPLVPNCDSIKVLSDTTGQPKDVLFYHKGIQTLMTFWDNMEKMSEGDLKNGLRNGRWTGFERNTGKKQSETDFSDGLENGSYVVYNENGTPIIVGQYKNGEKTGEWSFYDNEGNSAGSKNYDN